MAKAFDPSTWVDGVTVPHVSDYQAIALDLYSRGSNVDGGGYGRPNTSFLTLVPGALPGTTYGVTAASWSGGVVTLTIGAHVIVANQLVTVSGVTPTAYNVAFAKVTAVTGTTISYTLSFNPGAYASGGSVLVGSAPGNGTMAMDQTYSVKVYKQGSWTAATTTASAGIWYSGTGAPSASLGSNGDMYMDYATGNIYGPKTAGAWGGVGINVKGPTGATGPQGPPGPQGPAATIAVGTTTTGAPGSAASVTNTGSSSAAIFNFTIPRGDVGAQGPQGVGYTARGAWAAGTTYAQGDMVQYGSNNYYALQSANTNHQPDTSPTWWTPAGGGASQTPWLQDINAGGFRLYSAGNIGIGVPLASMPIMPVIASRRYLTIMGSGDAGTLEIATNAADADGTGLGQVAWTDAINNQTDKRLAIINVNRSGTTANNRGGAMAFYTRADGATAMSERMRIDNLGNVGIGTIGPITPAATRTYLAIKNSAGAGVLQLASGAGDLDGTNCGNIEWWDAATATRNGYISLAQSGATAGNRGSSMSFAVKANGGAQIVAAVIDNAGRVGIGTGTPLNLFQVHVGTDANIGIRLDGALATAAFGAFNDAGNAGVPMGFNASRFNFINGNVGIGMTTAPSVPLHVFGQASNEVARFQGRTDLANNRSFITCFSTNPNFWWELSNEDSGGNGSTNGFAFRERSGAASVVRLYLASGGNIGIGTTGPSDQLSLGGYGAIAMSTGNSTSFLLHQYMATGGWDCLSLGVNWKRTDRDTGTVNQTTIGSAEVSVEGCGSGGQLRFFVSSAANTAPAERMRITSAGNIGMGTPSPASNTRAQIDCPGGAYGLQLSQAGAHTFGMFVNASYFGMDDVTAGRRVITIDNSGNVTFPGTVTAASFSPSGGGVTTQNVVTASRNITGTVYQNTTGKPMLCSVYVGVAASSVVNFYSDSSSNPSTNVGGVQSTAGNPATTYATVSFWVLPGNYYKAQYSGTTFLTSWNEWY